MERRTLLRRATAVGAVGLAGCLSNATDSELAPGNSDRADSEAPSRTERSALNESGNDTRAADRHEPFETVQIGSREDVENPQQNRKRGLRITNDAEETRTFTLEVESDSVERYEASHRFGPGAALGCSLEEPATYQISVSTASRELTTFKIPREEFTCNYASTQVTIGSDWTVEQRTVTTEMACRVSPPTRSIEIVETGCLSTDSGSASLRSTNQTLVIEGSIRAPNPCFDVDIASIEEEADATTITIESTAPASTQPCVSCIGEISYEATVGFSDDVPEPIRVVHRTSRGEQVVAGTSSTGSAEPPNSAS